MLLRVDGTMRHTEAGELVTVRRSDLARIDPMDYDVAEA
jgi:hypothetical protein